MDLRTLMFAAVVLQICCAAGLLLMSGSVPGLKGLRWFSWAYASATAGLLLVIFNPSWPSPDGAVFLGRALVLNGAILLTQGVAEFVVPDSSTLGWGGLFLGLFAAAELYCMRASNQVV